MPQVLLVEPDKVFGQTTGRALHKAGYEVLWAKTAQSAVNVADSQKIVAVVLEIQLAKHNGVEFLYEFRSYPEWQAVPVIVYSSLLPTAAGLSDTVAEQLGIAAYHYKPDTSLAQLVNSVGRIVGTRAL